MMDRVKMVQVIRLVIAKELADKFGVVSSLELARRVQEAIEVEEVQEFEREHLKSLETAYKEKFNEVPF